MKLDLNNINFDWARNIWEDLRNKHLLPVAAVLVVALIAVPFVLGGSDEPVEPDVVIATKAGDQSSKLDPIAVEELRPNGQDVGSSPRNPFVQPPSKTTPDATVATPAAPSTGSTGSTGSSGASGDTTTDPPKTDSKKSDGPSTAYKIDIRFGTPGKMASKKNVAALTPFPSADDAYVVYLGAKDKGKTAVFLISTDVKATGDGICDPSETNCKTV